MMNGYFYDEDAPCYFLNEAEPNTYGLDVFIFVLTPGGIYPSQNNNCNKTGLGTGCASYILQYGNMNYLH